MPVVKSGQRGLGLQRGVLVLLHRPDLIDGILDGLERKLVILQAPVGFGKTETLGTVCGVLKDRDIQTVQLTARRGMSADELALALAGALGHGAMNTSGVLAAISALGARLCICIDAAERLGEDATPLQWLIEDAPDELHVLIAARTLPPLRLSRLRMRGLLSGFGPEDLRFDRQEMQQVLGPHLAAAEFDRAVQTLAGWPALVRLSLIALERPEISPTERETVLDGSHPYLRDFIVDEVLPSLGAYDLAMVRACSGLQSFTFEIAADLAGLTLDPSNLRRIESLAPLFIAEGDQAGWFRLHPVMAMVLTLMMADEPQQDRAARLVRAAKLFEDRQMLEKAVLYATLADDYPLIVSMIEKAGGVNLFLRAGYNVLKGIVQAVPHDVVLATPSLRLCRGVTLAKSGSILEARAVIDALIADTESGAVRRDASWDAALEHISSLIDVYEDRALDDDEIVAIEAEAATEHHENTWRLGWLFNHLAIFHTRRGDLKAAHAHALRSLSCYQEERFSYPQAFILCHLGYVNSRANRMETALTYCRQAEVMIHSRQLNEPNLLAIACVPLAALTYLQGNVDAARQMMEAAMPVMAMGEGWVDFFMQGYATLARARFHQAGWPAAQDVLRQALEVADSRGLTRMRLALGILQLEMLTRAGNLEAAQDIAAKLALPDKDWPTARERREASLALARLRLREGDATAAVRQLDALANECRQCQREGLLLRVNLLRAEAHWQLGAPDTAIAALQEAADLSLPGGQVQQYHDEGPLLSAAIRALVRRTGLRRLSRTTSDYLGRVAGAAGRIGKGRRGNILSLREAEVLSLLAEDLTNKAIARRLNLAEPTVKFHLKNLYAKLGVSRRALALSVGRASGLLPGPD